MEHKIAIVTGATDGIGKMTALQLAKKGYDVYVTGRNEQKCIDTVKSFQQQFPSQTFGYYLADFCQLNSVRKMAEKISVQLPKIDVLVNNAGAVFASRTLSSEGYEQTFSTNHLAPFLLTIQLLPLIKKSDAGRIVNVSSGSHYLGTMNFNDIHYNKGYFVMRAYERSKLANVHFTRILAKKLKEEGSNVTVNCLHPGFVKTSIGTKGDNTFFGWVWTAMTQIGAISVEDGAKTSVYLASSPEVAQTSGLYFDKCKPKTASKLALNDTVAEKLWTLSESLTQTYY